MRALALLALLTSLPGCQPRLTAEECVSLLDHYTLLVIEQAQPDATTQERAVSIKKAREAAARDPEFASCSNRVSRNQFNCALAAYNADQVERCLL
ncbi:MAG: hypothetical protein MK135_10375 [Polyangiaceae bacterium]|nr:hypothetical protein [Polyangiaceae bacterium]